MSADLIARLEAATEGSRELDCAIACAIDPGSHCSPWPTVADEQVWFRNREHKIVVPEFTTSLDAALTLVPADTTWKLSGGNRKEIFVFRADLWVSRTEISAMGRSQALALCIASLRARATS